MLYIRIVKINTIISMLMECFWGKGDRISSLVLEEKVCKDTIKQALDENIIKFETENGERYYRITPKGKKRMNEKN